MEVPRPSNEGLAMTSLFVFARGVSPEAISEGRKGTSVGLPGIRLAMTQGITKKLGGGCERLVYGYLADELLHFGAVIADSKQAFAADGLFEIEFNQGLVK